MGLERSNRMTNVPTPDRSAGSFLSEAERMRLLDENVTDFAIFTVDTKGYIVSWNKGAERILGYAEEEILNQPASILFTPEDRQQGHAAREFMTARQTGRCDDERWHLRKDGSRIWALGILTALYAEDGQLRGYAKILRDFTARKQSEEQIRTLNARLQRAMTETHHRIKNNLQIIAAMIDFQTLGRRDDLPTTEFKRLSNLVRALASVHDILTADAKSGGDATVVSLASLLENLLGLVQSTVGRSHIEHELEEVSVSARKGSAIAMIVNELVTNAIKHGQGNVWVALTLRENVAALSVRDDGPGFPEGFRTDSPLEPTGFFTGLELVEDLAKWDLDGEVEYANWPTGGGCVTVRFRIAE